MSDNFSSFFDHACQQVRAFIVSLPSASLRGQRPHVLVGFSGGADSVFLMLILEKLWQEKLIDLTAAHLNHGWRVEAGLDEEFCRSWCESRGISYVGKHVRDLPQIIAYNGSHEEVGRKQRRLFFDLVTHDVSADFIALAHHRQDQQETFFMRLFRGSSLDGLCGMQPIAGRYIRPMLTLDGAMIREYLKRQQISYCHDLTNDSPDFLRNRIRQQILPALNACDKRFDEKIMTTLEHLREENDFLNELVQHEFHLIFCLAKDGGWQGNLISWRVAHRVMQKRLLLMWLVHEKVPFQPSDGFLGEVLHFLERPSGGYHELGRSWGIQKQNKLFWILRTNNNH